MKTLSFITLYYNEHYFEKNYYNNISLYSENDDIEFILINLSNNIHITNYVIKYLLKELLSKKLLYYIRKSPQQSPSFNSLSFNLSNSLFTYYLNPNESLLGNEYSLLINNIHSHGHKLILHHSQTHLEYAYHDTHNYYCFNNQEMAKITQQNNHINIIRQLISLNNTYIHIHHFPQNNISHPISYENINNYELYNISHQKILTCFSILYNVEKFIDNFISDIFSQTLYNNISFIFINIPQSNNNHTNIKINNLNNFQNIEIINESYDYGLYNMWNYCINKANTLFVANINPDDIRGHNWSYELLTNFQPGISLVSPLYVPIYNITTHENLPSHEYWFNNQCEIINGNGQYTNVINIYSNDHMFQCINKKIISYNIPNCSPIWIKDDIHYDNNYFLKILMAFMPISLYGLNHYTMAKCSNKLNTK